MVLQPTRRTAEAYCYPRGGLLPRLLTLTLAGGYFLLRYSAFADSFLLGSGMLCAARTFLPCQKQRRQTVRLFCGCKVKHSFHYFKIFNDIYFLTILFVDVWHGHSLMLNKCKMEHFNVQELLMQCLYC